MPVQAGAPGLYLAGSLLNAIISSRKLTSTVGLRKLGSLQLLNLMVFELWQVILLLGKQFVGHLLDLGQRKNRGG